MIVKGIITDLPTPEEHAARVAKRRAHGKSDGVVAIGLKKRSSGKPTFFRCVFVNDEEDSLADWVVANHQLRDKVAVELDDYSVRMTWEVDDIARTSAVIRGNAIGIEDWDGYS